MSTSCFIDHHPGGHHAETHLRPKALKSLKFALLIALALMVLEAVGSWISGSLSLFADAIHVFADSAALGITLFASWLASRPQSPERSYGYYRVEVLAALLNGVLLIIMALFILKSAYDRFISPHPIEAGTMLWIASVGLLANIFMLFLLKENHSHSLNLRGAYLHILGDTLSSVAVIIGAILIQSLGWIWADTAASAFVALMIITMAVRLLLDSTHVLLEGTPRNLNPTEIEQVLLSHFPQITRIHDFHIWQITDHLIALTAHIEVGHHSAYENKVLLDGLSHFIREKYRIGHTTFQIEMISAKL
jgi:cobalt-zinc-cadmium efflux system protein